MWIFKTKGKMYWEDKRFDKLSISERSSYVGYVMQNPNHMICEKMIYDEVALGLRLRNIDEEKIKEKVHSVLKYVVCIHLEIGQLRH